MIAHLKGYLTGRLLVAMPYTDDSYLRKSLILVCGHDEKGAMGLILNQPIHDLTIQNLMEQMGLSPEAEFSLDPVYGGGAVEEGRGFVLHTADYQTENTLTLGYGLAITATIDILSTIAHGEGPRHFLLLLGYVGWGPGQLDSEIQDNVWLPIEPDEDIIFQTHSHQKWGKAFSRLGIQEIMLSEVVGNT